jgi:hypothetical protein
VGKLHSERRVPVDAELCAMIARMLALRACSSADPCWLLPGCFKS